MLYRYQNVGIFLRYTLGCSPLALPNSTVVNLTYAVVTALLRQRTEARFKYLLEMVSLITSGKRAIYNGAITLRIALSQRQLTCKVLRGEGETKTLVQTSSAHV